MNDQQVTPRPVFCVIEHAHRRQAIADEIVRGRYGHQGSTLQLGVEPDWLHAELPPDREWRLEWSKFYYGLDLAWAFATSGDAVYLRTWERLVRSWIHQVPIDLDTTDVIARRIQNWAYAWSAFAASPHFTGLTPGVEAELLQNIADQAQFVRGHLTRGRNHRTLELYALFIVALALPPIDPDGSLLAFAIAALHENLLTDVGPDGVQCEGSTHYHHVVLRSFLGARENARRFNLTWPDGYDERLILACEFAAHCHRPDGGIPALSDSDTGSYLDLLELAASLYDRPDWLYVATQGRSGTAPRDRLVTFEPFGYHIQRSGWGDGSTPFRDERFLIFDCARIGAGGHGHYDALNIEMAAGGLPLVVDPGRYTYSDAERWRHWFKGTAAHNTVVVDGCDQTPYRRGKPIDAASCRFLGRITRPGLDVLWGEVHSPCYEPVHQRRILFVNGEYWIVEDRIAAAAVHEYALRFHLAPHVAGGVTIESERSIGCAPAVRMHGLTLLAAGSPDVYVDEGWVSATYGIKTPAPIVRYVTSAADAEFLTLALPMAVDAPTPTFSVERTRDTTTLTLSGLGSARDCDDVVAWSTSGREASWRRESRALA